MLSALRTTAARCAVGPPTLLPLAAGAAAAREAALKGTANHPWPVAAPSTLLGCAPGRQWAAAAAAPHSRRHASTLSAVPSSYDVAVVGLGAFGSATAYHLSKLGASVLGVDLGPGPGHAGGSSHGATRIYRFAYREGEWRVAVGPRSNAPDCQHAGRRAGGSHAHADLCTVAARRRRVPAPAALLPRAVFAAGGGERAEARRADRWVGAAWRGAGAHGPCDGLAPARRRSARQCRACVWAMAQASLR